MKFIKVITKHTRQDINDIVSQFDKFYVEILTRFYGTFNHLEFITKEGFVAMYAAIDEKSIEKLFSEYVKCGIAFSYEDITKSVLFGNVPEILGEQEQLNLNALANQFVEENLDTNTVLDKIIESGFHTLTERDKKILKTH